MNFPNDYNPDIADPEAYNIHNNTKMLDLQYEEIKHETVTPQTNVKFENNFITSGFKEKKEPSSEKINIRQIWEKLNILKRKLRCNDVSDKRSACFWCVHMNSIIQQFIFLSDTIIICWKYMDVFVVLNVRWRI